MPLFRKSAPSGDGANSEEVEQLHKAMKGMGTDENEIINVAARHTAEERLDIAH